MEWRNSSFRLPKEKRKSKGPPFLASALWTPLSSLEGQHRTPQDTDSASYEEVGLGSVLKEGPRDSAVQTIVFCPDNCQRCLSDLSFRLSGYSRPRVQLDFPRHGQLRSHVLWEGL